MKAGINHGTIDSFVGSHYWYFIVEPGKFHVVFTWSGAQEIAVLKGHPVAGMAFVGNNPTAHLKFLESPTSTVFDGSVDKPTKVVVEVDPVNPRPGYVWVQGGWVWRGHHWLWVSGRWAHPPRPGAVWVGGHYEYRGGVNVYIGGGWR